MAQLTEHLPELPNMPLDRGLALIWHCIQQDVDGFDILRKDVVDFLHLHAPQPTRGKSWGRADMESALRNIADCTRKHPVDSF